MNAANRDDRSSKNYSIGFPNLANNEQVHAHSKASSRFRGCPNLIYLIKKFSLTNVR